MTTPTDATGQVILPRGRPSTRGGTPSAFRTKKDPNLQSDTNRTVLIKPLAKRGRERVKFTWNIALKLPDDEITISEGVDRVDVPYHAPDGTHLVADVKWNIHETDEDNNQSSVVVDGKHEVYVQSALRPPQPTPTPPPQPVQDPSPISQEDPPIGPTDDKAPPPIFRGLERVDLVPHVVLDVPDKRPHPPQSYNLDEINRLLDEESILDDPSSALPPSEPTTKAPPTKVPIDEAPVPVLDPPMPNPIGQVTPQEPSLPPQDTPAPPPTSVPPVEPPHLPSLSIPEPPLTYDPLTSTPSSGTGTGVPGNEPSGLTEPKVGTPHTQAPPSPEQPTDDPYLPVVPPKRRRGSFLIPEFEPGTPTDPSPPPSPHIEDASPPPTSPSLSTKSDDESEEPSSRELNIPGKPGLPKDGTPSLPEVLPPDLPPTGPISELPGGLEFVYEPLPDTPTDKPTPVSSPIPPTYTVPPPNITGTPDNISPPPQLPTPGQDPLHPTEKPEITGKIPTEEKPVPPPQSEGQPPLTPPDTPPPQLIDPLTAPERTPIDSRIPPNVPGFGKPGPDVPGGRTPPQTPSPVKSPKTSRPTSPGKPTSPARRTSKSPPSRSKSRSPVDSNSPQPIPGDTQPLDVPSNIVESRRDTRNIYWNLVVTLERNKQHIVTTGVYPISPELAAAPRFKDAKIVWDIEMEMSDGTKILTRGEKLVSELLVQHDGRGECAFSNLADYRAAPQKVGVAANGTASSPPSTPKSPQGKRHLPRNRTISASQTPPSPPGKASQNQKSTANFSPSQTERSPTRPSLGRQRSPPSSPLKV